MNFTIKDIDCIITSGETYKDIIPRTKEWVTHHFGSSPKVEILHHQTAHIASSFFQSGFDDAMCLSYDGVGDRASGAIAKASKDKGIEIIEMFPKSRSLGNFYSTMTNFLGFKSNEDEYKVMGLAPYGNPNKIIPGNKKSYADIFKKILIEKGKTGYQINLDLIDFYTKRDKWVTEKFISIFGNKRKPNEKITNHHRNIAAALQLRIEEVILKQLRYLRKKYGLSKLCIAGGVGLNCSLNGKIVENKIFDEIFVQPASGDDGCTIGACLLASKVKDVRFSPKVNHNSYLGSRFNNEQISKALRESGLKFSKPQNYCQTVAQLLSEGKIIAWFQGASEFGPRALGNRSILCKPFPGEMKDHLNNNVKFRESFRPFAPAVLEEDQKNFFELKQSSPHMLIACKVKKNAEKLIPAVVHIDKTCRVQTVKKKLNEKFYLLINEFKKITKIPVILNTSFNIKGQPIINNPEEAIKSFKNTKIDVLAIGDYIINKNDY